MRLNKSRALRSRFSLAKRGPKARFTSDPLLEKAGGLWRSREKLREFFRQEVRPELRAMGALNNVELITALISFNCQLGLVGLRLRILKGGGFAAHYPGRKQGVGRLCERAEWRARKFSNGQRGPLKYSPASPLQPISQAEIDQLFDADKRGAGRQTSGSQACGRIRRCRRPVALRHN